MHVIEPHRIKIHFNTYKLCGTVALDVVAVALRGDVVLSQGDVLQFVAVLEAVRGRQDVPPVDQRASAFVLDAPEDICSISKPQKQPCMWEYGTKRK